MNYPETEIDNIKQILEAGKVILYPTDTIWGIGCDAQDVLAIEKIRQIKSSQEEDRFILLVSSLEMLKKYIQPVPPKASNLILYHERPLTIIYHQVHNLPQCLLSKDGSIAIRVSQDPFCQAFIEAFGGAIISTSASIHGEAFPRSFQEISEKIKTSVDYIIPYRLKEVLKEEICPSRIVGFDERNELIFLRK